MQTYGERGGQTDTQTVRHEEANSRSSHQFKNIHHFEGTTNNPLRTPYFEKKRFIILYQLKLYWSVIRPVLVYGYETWVLKESVTQRLSVFERKILRKKFGPTKEENGNWRINQKKNWMS